MSKPDTLRATLARKFIQLGVGVAIGASVGATVVALHPATQTPHTVERPPVEDAPSTVLGQHRDECWRGNEPALADIPGHVIWQHPDGRTVYSKRLVGPALETVFADGHLAGRPIAFCR